MMARTVARVSVVLLALLFAGCAGAAPAAPPTTAGRPPSAPAAARYSLGVVRYAQGDVAGAIDAYRRVLAAEPQQLDARYSLALVLKLAQRDAEATPEFVAAAEAGHARAQYFAGTAYASGLGVARALAAAVAWWFRASEQGVSQAH